MKGWLTLAGLSAAAGAAVAFAHRYVKFRRTYGPWAALGPRLPGGVSDVPNALIQATGAEFVGGNRVAFCDDANIFESIAAAVRKAQHSIHVDIFIWKPGSPGEELAELVAQKAREGVAVRILVDPMGSPGFDQILLPRLVGSGCEVTFFRPLQKRPLTLTSRNHRKLVVVDGRYGFTGGFGIAPEWNSVERGGGGWRDVNVCVEGPVVRQMQLAFAAHWLESGGRVLPPEELQRAEPAGDVRAAFVTSMDSKGLSSARWVSQIVVAAAQRRLWIANAYFVPLPQFVRALCQRSSDGVDVRLLLPGPHQDHPTVTFIQRRLYPVLHRTGIRVHEYQPSMMHAKTMLVDDSLVVVGSMNLDPLSQQLLEEGALVMDDPRMAQELERRWALDVARSITVTQRTPSRPELVAEPAMTQ